MELFVADRAAIDVYGLVAAGVRVVDVLSLAGGVENKVRELFGKDVLARVLVEDIAALRFGRALIAVETENEATALLSAGARWWRGKEEWPEQGNDPEVILHVYCMGEMHRLAVRAGCFVALDHTREELGFLGRIGESLSCVNLDGILVTWTGLSERGRAFSRRSWSWLQRYARYESHAMVWTPRRWTKAGDVSELRIEPSLCDSPSVCLARTKPKKNSYRANRDYELIRQLSDAVSGMEVRWSRLAPVVYALRLEKEAARWESVVVADPARALLA